jgi:hypothetical protein
MEKPALYRDLLIRKIFPEFCFMEVLKRKRGRKFQFIGGCRARTSHEILKYL